jgi:hypothetical protein
MRPIVRKCVIAFCPTSGSAIISNRRVAMIMRTGVIILLMLGTTACAVLPSPTSTPGTTPEVVITAWTAEMRGKLVERDGCLQVIDQVDQSAYTLAWPADVSTVAAADTVTVTFGLVTGDRRQVVLHLGEDVQIGGGETEKLDAQLRQRLPANCKGPYWVIGNNIASLHAADETNQ